jgi:hypothetical protein
MKVERAVIPPVLYYPGVLSKIQALGPKVEAMKI